MRRILTAAVLVAALLVGVKLVPAWAFAAVFTALIVLGVSEAYRMLRRAGHRPLYWVGLAATLFLAWSFSGLPPRASATAVLTSLVVATLVAALWRRTDASEMYASVAHTLLPVLVFGLPLGFVIALRALPDPDGQDLPMLLFVCVALGDTAAYYVGSRFGRRRMAPTISPKKSWEGAVGGLVAAVLGGLLATAWFYRRLPWGHAAAIGGILGFLGILGDLSESMVKRALGSKDASRLLPGHGGVLDRLDSVLLAAPTLYGYWVLFLRDPP